MSDRKNKKDLDKEAAAERHERIALSLERIAGYMEFMLQEIIDSKEEDEAKVNDDDRVK